MDDIDPQEYSDGPRKGKKMGRILSWTAFCERKTDIYVCMSSLFICVPFTDRDGTASLNCK